MTATSEAQPGTRSGGIAPAQTLTGQPKGSRPNGKGTTKISLTDRIVSTAARWIYEGRRLDMQGLADELGVSRVTLFRRVGSREELISQALWRLTERMLEIAVERWEAERPEGEPNGPKASCTPPAPSAISTRWWLDHKDCAACWTTSPP